MYEAFQTIAKSTPANVTNEKENYELILSKGNISFFIDYPYIKVGTPIQTQGWLLHISSIISEFPVLLEKLLPIFTKYSYPYKLVQNKLELRKLNGGAYGSQKVGKAITIYLEDAFNDTEFITRLLEALNPFTGPRIETDLNIQGVLYFRYGGINPIIMTDSYGDKARLILNGEGALILDNYQAPPPVPNWIKNPFIPFIKEATLSNERLMLYKKFKPKQIIKLDKKGNVYLGKYLSAFLFAKTCIIKHGSIGVFSNEIGEDARHRVIWQSSLLTRLKRINNVPRVLHTLQERDQASLVTSFIKGSTLTQTCFLILSNRPWIALTSKEKKKILSYLIRVCNQVIILHKQGLIHRDITGNNFLVGPKGKIYIIDLELCYDTVKSLPLVPYTGGTPGYMSPDQELYFPPTITDDSYGIGALILFCLTGIEPKYMSFGNRDELDRKLSFIIRDEAIVELLKACLSYEKQDRPTINLIEYTLKSISIRVSNNKSSPQKVVEKYNSDSFDVLIQQIIRSLGAPQMTLNGVWFSYLNNTYDEIIHPHRNKELFSNIYQGVAGPIYSLLEAKKTGYDISPAMHNLEKSWKYLKEDTFKDIDQRSPGLYYGTTGIALLISKMVSHDLITLSPKDHGIIGSCFRKENPALSLMDGSAGDLISIIRCKGVVSSAERNPIINRLLDQIISHQRQDGSWELPDIQNSGGNINSFGYGISGILYSLLIYFEMSNDDQVLNSVKKGLKFLTRTAKNDGDNIYWENTSDKKSKYHWWCNGNAGISLLFLKAYEVTGDNLFLKFAEQSLKIHHPRILSQHICFCHGIAGLGEIYLEAYRITKNEYWYSRAEWIAQELDILSFKSKALPVYWLSEQWLFPTAELLTGISGIFHFYLKFQHPYTIDFLLL